MVPTIRWWTPSSTGPTPSESAASHRSAARSVRSSLTLTFPLYSYHTATVATFGALQVMMALQFMIRTPRGTREWEFCRQELGCRVMPMSFQKLTPRFVVRAFGVRWKGHLENVAHRIPNP